MRGYISNKTQFCDEVLKNKSEKMSYQENLQKPLLLFALNHYVPYFREM